MKRGAAGAALAAVLLIAAASGCMRAPSPAMTPQRSSWRAGFPATARP